MCVVMFLFFLDVRPRAGRGLHVEITAKFMVLPGETLVVRGRCLPPDRGGASCGSITNGSRASIPPPGGCSPGPGAARVTLVHQRSPAVAVRRVTKSQAPAAVSRRNIPPPR